MKIALTTLLISFFFVGVNCGLVKRGFTYAVGSNGACKYNNGIVSASGVETKATAEQQAKVDQWQMEFQAAMNKEATGLPLIPNFPCLCSEVICSKSSDVNNNVAHVK